MSKSIKTSISFLLIFAMFFSSNVVYADIINQELGNTEIQADYDEGSLINDDSNVLDEVSEETTETTETNDLEEIVVEDETDETSAEMPSEELTDDTQTELIDEEVLEGDGVLLPEGELPEIPTNTELPKLPDVSEKVKVAENKAIDTEPTKINSTYGVQVRNGGYANSFASFGSTTMPKEFLDTKWAEAAGYSRKSFMEFGSSDQIDWENVDAIKLMIYAESFMGNGRKETLNFYRTYTEKSEENWTWNEMESAPMNLVGNAEFTGSEKNINKWIEVDVTDLKDYYSNDLNQTMFLGVFPEKLYDQGGIRFYSKYYQDGKYSPYLIVYKDGQEILDLIPPTLSVSGLNDGSVLETGVLDFTVNASDNSGEDVTITMIQNGVSKVIPNGLNSITLKQGVNNIKITAEDSSGNVSQTLEYTITYTQRLSFVTQGDAYVHSNTKTTNYGTDRLLLKTPAVTGSNDRHIYLKFDLSEFDKDYVKEATIRMYADELVGTDRTSEVVSIYQVEPFDEKTITWNNVPRVVEKAADAEYSRVVAGGGKATYVYLNISEFINRKIVEGETSEIYLKLVVENGHDQKGSYFRSKETARSTEEKPTILLDCSGLPEPTINVSGLEDNSSTYDSVIENVFIKGTSVNDNISVTTKVDVNGFTIGQKDGNKYDIPLNFGENIIKVSVFIDSAPELSKEISFKIHRFQKYDPGVYYVDSMYGDDNNDGLSEDTPWQTLDKLNSIEFQPGTTILLKRGSVWNGQFRPKGNGSAEALNIIDAYGNGSRPIINGNGISDVDTGKSYPEGALHFYNVSFWEVNNLEITNYGPDVNKAGRTGINIVAGGSGYVEHVYVRNCYVHDVNSNSEAAKISGGIIYTCNKFDENGNVPNIPSSFRDVLVEDCHVKNVSIEGVRTKTETPQRSTDVVFRNNLIEEIWGDAIVIGEVSSGAIVEKNIIRRHSMCNLSRNYAGLWLYASNDAVIEYNEVYDGVYGYNDGEAFDFDISANRNIYQYNLSHNNRGGLLLSMKAAGSNNIFRYNVSQNDGNNTELFFCMANNIYIYNNTIYVGKDRNLKYLIKEDLNNYKNMYFKNNLIYVDGNIENFSQAAGNPVMPNVTNNAFYPPEIATRSGSPLEMPELVGELPLLVNPSAELEVMDEWDEEIWTRNLNNFKLQYGSPLIDKGADIVIPTAVKGATKDIFGNPLIEGAIDIGAHEYTVPDVKAIDVIETLEDLYLSVDNTKLVLPEIPDGFTLSIADSSHKDIVSLDGNVYQSEADTEVQITVRVVRIEGAETLIPDIDVAEKTYKIIIPKKPEIIDPYVAVTDIQLNSTMYNMEVGQQAVLVATISPTNATNKDVMWTSDKPEIVSVIDGKIVALSQGTATIEAKSSNGKTAKCVVNVVAKIPVYDYDNSDSDNSDDSYSKDGEKANAPAENTTSNDLAEMKGSLDLNNLLEQTVDNKVVIGNDVVSISILSHILQQNDDSKAQKIDFSMEVVNPNVVSKSKDEVSFKLELSEDGKPISKVESPINISLKYDPVIGKNEVDYLLAYYKDENKLIPISNTRYDEVTKSVMFDTKNIGEYVIVNNKKTFDDLEGYETAQKAIEVLASKNIINGTSENTYSPEKEITRADFIVLLVNTLELEADVTTNFYDVGKDSYYYNSVGIAKELNLINGVGENLYNPKESISNNDALVILNRAIDLKADTEKVDRNAIREKILEGVEEKSISESANRADVAVVLYNVFNLR